MATFRTPALRQATGFLHTERLTPFARASYLLSLVCVTLGAVLTPGRPELALLAAAMLCGWSEVDGLCGTSHVGTLTPLRLLSPTGSLWLKGVSAYTVGGLITACCVGFALGALGWVLQLSRLPSVLVPGLILISALALVLAARELGVIRFALPQVHRQTHKVWAVEHGMITGSAMWGAHIGLSFATVVQHGGFFIVVSLALVNGAATATLLMAAYWIGRTLPLWFAGTLPLSQCSGPDLLRALLRRRAAYRHCAAIGLLMFAVIAVRLTV